MGIIAIGAGIAIGLAALGIGIGQGFGLRGGLKGFQDSRKPVVSSERR